MRIAKAALSEQPSYDLLIGAYPEAFRLTRPEFDELIAAMAGQAAEEMRRTIIAAGLEPGQLAHLHLTGGSCRTPAIATTLSRALGIAPPGLERDPETVVALGALAALTAEATRTAGPQAAPHATEPQAHARTTEPQPASAVIPPPSAPRVTQPPAPRTAQPRGVRQASMGAAVPSREPHRLQHGSFVNSVAFSPDGSLLATGCQDRLARIWDAGTGREIACLQHGGMVNSVAFSPDGALLATGSSGDKLARIWGPA